MFKKKATAQTHTPALATGFALGFICLCLGIAILIFARGIMIPFVIALFFWYLINATARGFSRLRINGFILPRFLCFSFAVATMLVGIWVVYQMILNNIVDVVAAVPTYQKNFEAFIPKLLQRLPLDQQPTVQELIRYLDLGTMITILAKTFTGLAGKALVVLFYTGFFLYEQRFFDHKIRAMIDDQGTEDHVRSILRNIDSKIQRYMAVKTFVSALTGVLTWAVLRYMGVDFADFWGLMAFILNFIPYVGSLAAILLPSIIALIQFSDLSVAFTVVSGLSLIQLSVGSVLDPRLMGDSLNLSPICIILSLAVWGLLWGIPGMFLSIPILAMIMITLSQFPGTRPIAILISKTGELDKTG